MKKNQGSNSPKLFTFDANCIYTHPRSSTGPKQLKHGENYTETRQNQIAQNWRKREMLKSKRKEIYDVQRNKDENDNRLLLRNNVRRQWNSISKVMKEKTI